MPAIVRALVAVGWAAILGGLAAAAVLTALLEGWAAAAAATLAGFAGIYAGVIAIAFAANLRLIEGLRDRRDEGAP